MAVKQEPSFNPFAPAAAPLSMDRKPKVDSLDEKPKVEKPEMPRQHSKKKTPVVGENVEPKGQYPLLTPLSKGDVQDVLPQRSQRTALQPGKEKTRQLYDVGGLLDSQTTESQAINHLELVNGIVPDIPTSPGPIANDSDAAPLSPALSYTSRAASPQSFPRTPENQQNLLAENLRAAVMHNEITAEWADNHRIPGDRDWRLISTPIPRLVLHVPVVAHESPTLAHTNPDTNPATPVPTQRRMVPASVPARKRQSSLEHLSAFEQEVINRLRLRDQYQNEALFEELHSTHQMSVERRVLEKENKRLRMELEAEKSKKKMKKTN